MGFWVGVGFADQGGVGFKPILRRLDETEKGPKGPRGGAGVGPRGGREVPLPTGIRPSAY